MSMLCRQVLLYILLCLRNWYIVHVPVRYITILLEKALSFLKISGREGERKNMTESHEIKARLPRSNNAENQWRIDHILKGSNLLIPNDAILLSILRLLALFTHPTTGFRKGSSHFVLSLISSSIILIDKGYGMYWELRVIIINKILTFCIKFTNKHKIIVCNVFHNIFLSTIF